MNIAVILAGGIGRRMGSEIPKQFLMVIEKPVIVHTIEKFQENSEIDFIEVVCVDSYIDEVWSYVKTYKLTKIKWVIKGGKTAQESIRNSIYSFHGVLEDDDILLFHMSVSPLIDDRIINDSISVCGKYGNAIAAGESIFNLCKVKEGYYSDEYYSKTNLVTLNMPWSIKYGKGLWAYQTGDLKGLGTEPNAYLVSLLIDLGEKLYFSMDSQKNKLKLTTFDDVDMLEGYLILKQERKKKG